MFPSDATLVWMYELCDKDDDCQRGVHEGPCGPCVCSVKHSGSCSSAASRVLAERAVMP